MTQEAVSKVWLCCAEVVCQKFSFEKKGKSSSSRPWTLRCSTHSCLLVHSRISSTGSVKFRSPTLNCFLEVIFLGLERKDEESRGPTGLVYPNEEIFSRTSSRDTTTVMSVTTKKNELCQRSFPTSLCHFRSGTD